LRLRREYVSPAEVRSTCTATNGHLNSSFAILLGAVVTKFECLLGMEPVPRSKQIPLKAGVYLLSEGDAHCYVGRANNLRSRVAQLRNLDASMAESNLAMLIARDDPLFHGLQRKTFARMPEFKLAFQVAKRRVAAMHLRYVEEADDSGQRLLQLYAAVALTTRYQD
jgi:hypothetical protein